MIDERRIVEAAFDFNDGELTNDKLIRAAFIYSAKWMQEEFLKKLWHKTDEEPEGYDEWILLHGYVWEAYIGRHLLRSNINNVSDLQHLLFCLGLNSEMEV